MSVFSSDSLTKLEDWQQVQVAADTSLITAMQLINAVTQLRVVFVVDDARRLVGAVTDGDIRRGLLRGLRLESPVREVMNTHPISVSETETDIEAKLALMRGRDVFQLPVVNDKGQIIAVETVQSLLHQQKRPEEVVLMAGGLGSRLKERTEHTPKPLLSIGGKPILETILENFVEYGFSNFTISLGYRAQQIRDYFGDGSRWGVRIRYVEEESPLGTAGALKLLNPRPEHTFFVMNGDVLTKVNFRQMLRYHHEQKAKATMCVRGFANQIPYGVVRTEGAEITGFEEKPVQNVMVNAGVYVLEPDVLDAMPEGRVDMPSLFDALRKNRQRSVAFPIHEYWADVGSPGDFDAADQHYPTVFGT